MKKILNIHDYANDINLYDEFRFIPSIDENKDELVDALLLALNEEKSLASSYADKRRFLHAKLNTLPPNTLDKNAIDRLNRLLQLELQDKNITSANELAAKSTKSIGKTKLIVWQGDITNLKADSIVNAANSQMLGCWQPLHACIDNTIHTAAGVQLRDDCDIIMGKQGFVEPTAVAKITRAYNLPSKFVIHTVGPIVQGQVSEQNKADLAKAYLSCLETANEIESIKSIAFCGISTGVFGYPPAQAAKVAFSAVIDWLKKNPDALDLVIFDVFSDNDKAIYDDLVAGL